VSFVESWRPRWTDFVLVAMAVGLWVVGGAFERYIAVLLLLWPLARTLRNRHATTVSPTGLSWSERGHPREVRWANVERLIAVDGLIIRRAYVVERGGGPKPLPTPIAFRIARPRRFDKAVVELQRWATAHGRDLRVERMRTYPTWAAVLAMAVMRGVPLGVVAYDLIRRHDGRPLSDNTTFALFLVAFFVVPLVVGQLGRRGPA
jgi:hypothetical protein